MGVPRICKTCIYRHQGANLDPCNRCMDIVQLPQWKWDRPGKSKIDQLKQDFILARKAYLDTFAAGRNVKSAVENFNKSKNALGECMVDIWFSTIGKPEDLIDSMTEE